MRWIGHGRSSLITITGSRLVLGLDGAVSLTTLTLESCWAIARLTPLLSAENIIAHYQCNNMVTPPPDLFRTDTNEGIIYPHCFQRLRYIEVVTAHCAVWGTCFGGSYLTHIAQLILNILRVLAEEEGTASAAGCGEGI